MHLEAVGVGQVYLLPSRQPQHWLFVLQELGGSGLWACYDLKGETLFIVGSEILEKLSQIRA